MNRPDWIDQVVEVTPDEAEALVVCGCAVWYDYDDQERYTFENQPFMYTVGTGTVHGDSVQRLKSAQNILFYIRKEGTDDE